MKSVLVKEQEADPSAPDFLKDRIFKNNYSVFNLSNVLRFTGLKPWKAKQLADSAELTKEQFINSIIQANPEFPLKYEYLRVSFEVQEGKRPVFILLGGTSGSGKSTLASLLASRMGIRNVVATDHIRHLLRSVHDKETMPYLFVSSYQAGEFFNGDIIKGFELQAEKVVKSLETLLDSMAERGESCIVEGVHLSPKQVTFLRNKYPQIVPFLIYISNETKHTERFAIRAKYMALEPRLNRYVKYFADIRAIQDYLCLNSNDKFPIIDNTNIDRSLAILHQTVINYLAKGGDLLDTFYQVQESRWSAKQVLKVIQAKRERISQDLLLDLYLESLGS